MANRLKQLSLFGGVGLSAVLVALALAGCGAGSGGSATEPVATAPAVTPATDPTATDVPGAAAPSDPAVQGWTATLTWPRGTDPFALNVCTSIGEHTILGGGNSGDLNLSFDANLLNSGDTGRLSVSQRTGSDMPVVYDATITSLTVKADGTFSGSGQDAGGAAFSVSGTCELSW